MCAEFVEYVGYVCGRGGVGLVAGAFTRERTLSETYVEVETRVKALLDAEGVELRGMAVEGMAVEVEPAVP